MMKIAVILLFLVSGLSAQPAPMKCERDVCAGYISVPVWALNQFNPLFSYACNEPCTIVHVYVTTKDALTDGFKVFLTYRRGDDEFTTSALIDRKRGDGFEGLSFHSFTLPAEAAISGLRIESWAPKSSAVIPVK
jgi:hypothetical protein